MLETIVALITAPLWLAISKKRVAAKSRPPVTKAKRAAVRPPKRPARAKQSPVRNRQQEPEPEPEVVELPPPPAPVQAPGLFSPSPGEVAETLTPSFRWFYTGGASHYQLVWSLDSHFHKQHILLTTQTAASLPLDEALPPESTFYWRVRGGNAGGWGPWSPARTFRTPGS